MSQVNEISKGTIGRYLKKTPASAAQAGNKMAGQGMNPKDNMKKGVKGIVKRSKGVSMAVDKMTGKAKVPATESFVIPEEIPANERTAFHGAAAAAAKSGKKSFNFGGKTHPVTMKKDTATKIADQKEETDEAKRVVHSDKPDRLVTMKIKDPKKKSGETATMNPKVGDKKDKGSEMEQKESTMNFESIDYHKKMAYAHQEHGETHEREATNTNNSNKASEHDFASDYHHDAADHHKAAIDAHKKHGGNSTQYKSASDKAHKASNKAHEGSRDAGKIKKVAPPKSNFPNKPSMKESTIRDKLIAVLEGDRSKHYKGATPPEDMDNNLKGAGAKKMKADIQGNAADPDLEKKSHDDAAKAGRAGPNAKKRPGDNPAGDKKAQTPEDPTKKGQGSAEVKESRDQLAGIKAAYAGMYNGN